MTGAGKLCLLYWVTYGLALAGADWLVLSEPPLGWRVIGAALLLFILPGAALASLTLPNRLGFILSEWLVLSAGASAALSVMLLWLIVLLPFDLSTANLVGALNILCLSLSAAAIIRSYRQPRAKLIITRRERRFLFVLALLVAASLLIVLTRLDHGDLSGDERKPVSRAADILLGHRTSLYTLPRPPGQILLVMGIMRLGDSLAEWVLRLPFALSGVIAMAALVLLARSRLPWTLCALGGILLISQGVVLEMARWIQYQVYVLAMMELALYCAWRGWSTRHTSHSTRYWLLAALFSAAGLLGHYDAAWLAPAILFLLLRSQSAPLLSRRTIRSAGSVVVLGLLLSAPFYFVYLTYPGVLDSITGAEVGGRVAFNAGPFNHLSDFFLDMWFFDSAFRAGAVLALLVVAALATIWRRPARVAWWIAALVTTCLAAVLLLSLPGGTFALAGIDLAFVPFALLGIVLLWRLVPDTFWRAVLLWFFAVFGFTGFLMLTPYDQYYLGMPSLFLVACYGLGVCWAMLQRALPLPQRPTINATALLAGGIWLLGSLLYAYDAHIALIPNQLTANPALDTFPFGQLTDIRFQAPGYYVSAAGWRAVAVLYERGELRGQNSTTVEPVRDWYLVKEWTPPAPAERYYIAAPQQKAYFKTDPAPADLATAYALWGTLLVDGDPQIRIYERTNGRPLAARVLNAEDYEAEWQRSATFSRMEGFKSAHRNDPAFYTVSRALQAGEREGDGLVVAGEPARFVLNQYYAGQMPYANPGSAASLSAYRRIWGVFWPGDHPGEESSLAAHAFTLSAQWFDNIRVRTYAVAPTPPPVPSGARLGDTIHLENVSALPPTVRAGDALLMQLRWQTDAQVPSRYKVFVHISDARGAALAQYDAEPVADLRPTDSWLPGETIDDRFGIVLPRDSPPGRYTVLAGLYSQSDGARLPARPPEGDRYPDDAIPLGALNVVPN